MTTLPKMINGNKERCWCPMCRKNKRPYTINHNTAHHGAVSVCWYGMCKKCALICQKAFDAGKDDVMLGLMDKVERNLAERYPHIKPLLAQPMQRQSLN